MITISGGPISSTINPTYTATAYSGGQTGAAAGTTNSTVYDISTGGAINNTENNADVVHALDDIYTATSRAMAAIATNASTAATTAAANPLLETPPSTGGTSIWVILGALAGIGALVYYAVKGKL